MSNPSQNQQTTAAEQDPSNLFRDFCNTTSGHGFFKISNTEHRVIRTLWLVLLVLAVVGGFVHIGINIKRYLDYDVNAEIEIQGDSPFEFPDVTICPNSRYFFRKGLEPSKVNKPYFLMADASVPSLGDNVTFEMIWNNANLVWSELLGNPANNQHKLSARFSTNPYIWEAQVVRHKLSVVTQCMYQGRECNYKNYTEHYHPDVNLCITFDASSLLISRLDMESGLKMRLLLPYIGSDDDEEAKLMTGEETDLRLNGATVILHPRGTLPYLSETNFVVSRGKKATVAVEMQTVEFMEVNGRCSSTLSPISIVGNEKPFVYSRHACQQVYYQEKVVKKCRCRSELYYTPSHLKDKPFCHKLKQNLFTFDNYTVEGNGGWKLWRKNGPFEYVLKTEIDNVKQNHECHDRVTTLLENSPPNLLEQCPTPCSSSTYDISVNIADINKMDSPFEVKALQSHYSTQLEVWQNQGLYTQVLEKLLADLPNVKKLPTRVYVGNLNLYPAFRMRKVIREFLTYPMENFLSDLGGVFGFWLGFSIITIIELLELVTLLCGVSICTPKKAVRGTVNPKK